MKLFTLIFVAAFMSIPGLVSAEQGEEAAVQRVVEATTGLCNAETLELLVALYADDAKIYSRIAGGQASKMRYREIVERAFSQRTVSRVDTDRL